ncbi:MAG TPA: CvpA family protein [Polyangiaceae bacterium]|nr:CvpA family protein [Polyangiaceae bacterium]
MSDATPMANALNAIDVFLGVVLLLTAWVGYRRGFIAAALQLLGVLVSVLVALLGYRSVARVLEAHAPALGVWTWPLGFVATLLLAQLVTSALGAWLVRALPRRVHEHGLNRALGVLPGFLRGLILASLLSVVLLTLPLVDGLSRLTRESKLASGLSVPAAWLDCALTPIFDPAVQRTLQALTVPPESRASIDLRFTVPSPRVRPDLESDLLKLVNTERTAQGRRALQADAELTQVARAHGRDMLARGYFAHVTPDGEDLSNRLGSAQLRYLVAGENLALAPTVEIAHQNLMNSPGHRENLLRAQFGRLGIGVLDAGRHGLIVVENFRN